MNLDTLSPLQISNTIEGCRYNALRQLTNQGNALLPELQTGSSTEYFFWRPAGTSAPRIFDTEVEDWKSIEPKRWEISTGRKSENIRGIIKYFVDCLLNHPVDYRDNDFFIDYHLKLLQSTKGITAGAKQTIYNLLRNVRIPNIQEIFSYLSTYPDMISIMPDICSAFVNRFKGKAQLSLELYRNPENEDKYLTLYVRQDEYEEDIMESIENTMSGFDELLSVKKGWLIATTDFQPPR